MTAATPSAGIVVSDVARSFGAVHAVSSATLVAEPGHVTGLIGPNGSGKTTLMLMLASLVAPDRGSIRIDGHDPVTEPALVRAAMGWMPDVLGSWSSLTVRRVLEFTGRLYGFERSRAASRAAELITLVDLDPLADQPSKVLSRGQKQRLSLARALVHDPSVLLLDEPASGLDPGARQHLRVLVRRFAAEGRTVLVSSHVLAELDEMADAAVYMDAGVTASAERIARAKTSMRSWRIRSLDPSALRGHLAAAGIPPEQIGADVTALTVPVAGEPAAAELLARLLSAGVRVTSFAPAVGDLEHTFLDLSSDGSGA